MFLLPVKRASLSSVNAPVITGFVLIPMLCASRNSSNGFVPASFISAVSSISGTM